MDCPNCQSTRTRRGGRITWSVYLLLIALAIAAVLFVHLNAAIVGGIMIAAIVITHLLAGERVCLECGHQWRNHA